MLRGIHTALVTPFDDAGAVDLGAFERLAQRQVDAGIHGLVPCGTTGETPTLEPTEWDALLAAAKNVSGGRIPVTVGVGTNATASTVANCRRAREAGADAGLLVFPYYNKPNPAGHRAHVQAAAATGLPLVLYHVPGRTGQRLPAALVAELTDLDGVVALKEATGDVQYGTDVLTQTAKAVLSGDDFSMLGLWAQGGAGAISVLSNVAPAQTVAIWDAFQAGRHAEAQAGLARLWELCGYLFSDVNPAPTKACLEALGLCGRGTRGPLAPVDGPLPSGLLERAGLL